MEQNTKSETIIADQTPPNSIDTERSILASILYEPTLIEELVDNLPARGGTEIFYSIPNKIIADSLVELYKTGVEVDIVTVCDYLRDHNKIEKVGGELYISETLNKTATTTNLKAYIDKITEKYLKREEIRIYNQGVLQAYDSSTDPKETADLIEEQITALYDQREKKRMCSIGDTLPDVFSILQRTVENGGLVGTSTGFADLDEATTGFHPGDLAIIAARPGMGKSALVTSMALNSSIRNGDRVVVFSLEMPREQLTQRMLCSESSVELSRLRSGNLIASESNNEFQKISEVATTLKDAPIHVDDSGSLTILDIKSRCRKLKRVHGTLGLIIIDYLQLMSGVGKAENRQAEISKISRGLKELAKELEVPIIALSQLSRSVEQRAGDNRPMLSDLRESGAIEQDADIVLFLYRKAYYMQLANQTDSDEYKGCQNSAELIIAKQRNGACTTINLIFDGQYTRFSSGEFKQEEIPSF